MRVCVCVCVCQCVYECMCVCGCLCERERECVCTCLCVECDPDMSALFFLTPSFDLFIYVYTCVYTHVCV